MADTPSPLTRIDAAIARIEAASRARAAAAESLADRHDALRAKIAQAIGAIDEMIASPNDAGTSDAEPNDVATVDI